MCCNRIAESSSARWITAADRVLPHDLQRRATDAGRTVSELTLVAGNARSPRSPEAANETPSACREGRLADSAATSHSRPVADARKRQPPGSHVAKLRLARHTRQGAGHSRRISSRVVLSLRFAYAPQVQMTESSAPAIAGVLRTPDERFAALPGYPRPPTTRLTFRASQASACTTLMKARSRRRSRFRACMGSRPGVASTAG